jgi:hypothetical protein
VYCLDSYRKEKSISIKEKGFGIPGPFSFTFNSKNKAALTRSAALAYKSINRY